MDYEHEIDEVKTSVDKLEDCIGPMKVDIGKLLGSADTVEKLLKYVVLPLLVIVGGLVGIKMVVPGG